MSLLPSGADVVHAFMIRSTQQEIFAERCSDFWPCCSQKPMGFLKQLPYCWVFIHSSKQEFGLLVFTSGAGDGTRTSYMPGKCSSTELTQVRLSSSDILETSSHSLCHSECIRAVSGATAIAAKLSSMSKLDNSPPNNYLHEILQTGEFLICSIN